MNIVDFSWQSALIGGALIGLASVTMMLGIGKIAGISGIFSRILKPKTAVPWQWAFILGMLISGVLTHFFYSPIVIQTQASTPMLILAGLLVGFGTRLGNGCTSGHGVCGISRFSPRAIIATLVFIGTGMLTVFLLSLLSGAL